MIEVVLTVAMLGGLAYSFYEHTLAEKAVSQLWEDLMWYEKEVEKGNMSAEVAEAGLKESVEEARAKIKSLKVPFTGKQVHLTSIDIFADWSYNLAEILFNSRKKRLW